MNNLFDKKKKASSQQFQGEYYKKYDKHREQVNRWLKGYSSQNDSKGKSNAEIDKFLRQHLQQFKESHLSLSMQYFQYLYFYVCKIEQPQNKKKISDYKVIPSGVPGVDNYPKKHHGAKKNKKKSAWRKKFKRKAEQHTNQQQQYKFKKQIYYKQSKRSRFQEPEECSDAPKRNFNNRSYNDQQQEDAELYNARMAIKFSPQEIPLRYQRSRLQKVQQNQQENLSEGLQQQNQCQFQGKPYKKKTMDLIPIRDKIKVLLDEFDFQKLEDRLKEKDFQLNSLRLKKGQTFLSQFQEKDLQFLQKQYALIQNLNAFVRTTLNHIERQLDVADSYQLIQDLSSRLKSLKKKIQLNLPISYHYYQLIQSVESQQVTLLIGQTGSGKSTQISQIIEHANWLKGKQTKILTIQPRKIATKQLAKRVSQQMCIRVGRDVGYATGFDSNFTQKTNIVFMLDRIFINELIKDLSVPNYDYVIIDQAHQRTLNIDLILGAIKQTLILRPQLKVIVTSATVDERLFAQYFDIKTVLKIPGRAFPVEIKYVDGVGIGQDQGCMSLLTGQILGQKGRNLYPGHILVFCQGVDQIERLCELTKNKLFQKKQQLNYEILQLHGKLKGGSLEKVFAQSKKTKIIFSSRIAETALTIKGVGVVIDMGKDRQSKYYPDKRLIKIQSTSITKAAAKQRAGRTGRTNKGVCFRLYSQNQFQQFQDFKVPEIERSNLDIVVLRLLDMGIPDILTFDFLTPPAQKSLLDSLESLRLLGAISHSNSLTNIGRVMSKLPIQPFFTRSFVQAILIDMVKDTPNVLVSKMINVMCLLSRADNLFYTSFKNSEELSKSKMQMFYDEQGDISTIISMYNQYLDVDIRQRKSFCRAIRDAEQTIKEVHYAFNDRDTNPLALIQDFASDYYTREEREMIKGQNQKENLLRCLLTSFIGQLSIWSGISEVGYYLITKRINLHIYGTSVLTMIQEYPKFILAYNIVNTSKNFCKIAQLVSPAQIRRMVRPQILQQLGLEEMELTLPIYKKKIYQKLPNLILSTFQRDITNKIFALPDGVQFSANHQRNQLTFFIPQQEDFTQACQKIQEQIQLITNDQQLHKRHFLLTSLIKGVIMDGMQCEKVKLQLPFEKIVLQVKREERNKLYELFEQMLIGCQLKKKQVDMIQIKSQDSTCLHKWMSYLYRLKELQTTSKFQLCKFIIERQKKGQVSMEIQEMRGVESLIGMVKEGNIETDELRYLVGVMKSARLSSCNLTRLSAHTQCMVRYFLSEREQNDNRRYRQSYVLNVFYNKSSKVLQNIDRDVKILREEVGFQTIKINSKRTGFFYRINRNTDQIIQHKKLQLVLSTLAAKSTHLQLAKGFRCLTFRQQADFKQIDQRQNLLAIFQKLQIAMPPIAFAGSFGALATFKLIPQNFKEIKKLKALDHSLRKLGTEMMHVDFVFVGSKKIEEQIFKCLPRKWQKTLSQIKQKSIYIDVYTYSFMTDQGRIHAINVRSTSQQAMLHAMELIQNCFKGDQLDFGLKEELMGYFKAHGKQCIQEYQKTIDRMFNLGALDYYFSYNARKRRITLYCETEDKQRIETKFRELLLKDMHHRQLISYRGKSIRGLFERENETIRKVAQMQVYLQIMYSSKKILLIGKIQNLQKAVILIQNHIQEVKDFQCQICYSNLSKDSYMLLNCSHLFCRGCLRNQIFSAENDRSKLPIKCPSDSCQQMVAVGDIQELVGQKEYQMLCTLCIQKYIGENGDNFVSCPIKDCDVMIPKHNSKDKQMQCPHCLFRFCSNCKGPEHPNQDSCEQAKDDKLNQQLGCKKCPKCKVMVFRTEGCNHMKCHCGAHFCWICLIAYKTQVQCYSHLTKVHQDYFARDPNAPNPNNMLV